MYADDTNIFLSSDNMKTLYRSMNTELKRVNEWIILNKLTLNLSKTSYNKNLCLLVDSKLK